MLGGFCYEVIIDFVSEKYNENTMQSYCTEHMLLR